MKKLLSFNSFNFDFHNDDLWHINADGGPCDESVYNKLKGTDVECEYEQFENDSNYEGRIIINGQYEFYTIMTKEEFNNL